MNGTLATARTSVFGKAFDLVVAAFVAALLISNVASTKILALGPFTFDGAKITLPLSERA